MATWFRNPFRRERKAAVSPVNAAAHGALFSALFSGRTITPLEAWRLYQNSSSLARVVDLIADEVARLKPAIKINGDVGDDTPAGQAIHAFLKRPGFNRTRQRFIKELAVQYLVSGTAYPIAYGNSAMKGALPIAIDIAKSQFISLDQDFDMWPRTYFYAEGTQTQNFIRDRSNPRDFRWFDSHGLAEIVPIYDMDGDARGVGLARINAIKMDVELRVEGILHNANLLKKGARLSGVLSFKEQLTEEQKESVQSDFQRQAQGSENAGGVLVTAGGDMNWQALSQTMKDMDFAKLIEIVEDAIVSRYNVPITLYRTTAQTNNNYETAWDFFYNLAALPCFEVIYSGLAQIFTERLGVEVEIVHDVLSNPVLQKQAINKAQKLTGNTPLVSRNEGREIIGYEPVLGGDTIYGSMAEVPQAEDYFTNHGINDQDADNSREAYHAARPENDPIQRAGAEAEARAAGAAAGNPDKDKDKPSGKKPAKDKKSAPPVDSKKTDEAYGVLLQFAATVGKHSGADPPSRKGRRAA